MQNIKNKSTTSQNFENYSQYLAAIVESSDDAIIGKDLKGTINSWNRGAEVLYGYKKEEVLGKSIKIIYPKFKYLEFEKIMTKIRKGKKIIHYETIRQRKNGSLVSVSMTISPIKNQLGKVIGASTIGHDISEKKLTEIIQDFLIQASQVLSSSLDYQTTLQSVANLAVSSLTDWCTVDMLNENGSVDLLAIAHINPQKVTWAKKLRQKFPIDMSLKTGLPKVLKSGKSEIYPFIDDELLVKSAKSQSQLKLLRKLNFKSVMIVPLKIGSQILGAMTFVSTHENSLYTQQELVIAEELARRATQAVENSRLYFKTQQEIKERIKIENHLRHSEQKLRQLVESNIIGVFYANETGLITEANDTFLKISGYSRNDLKKGLLNWHKLSPPEYEKSDLKRFMECQKVNAHHTKKSFLEKMVIKYRF